MQALGQCDRLVDLLGHHPFVVSAAKRLPLDQFPADPEAPQSPVGLLRWTAASHEEFGELAGSHSADGRRQQQAGRPHARDQRAHVQLAYRCGPGDGSLAIGPRHGGRVTAERGLDTYRGHGPLQVLAQEVHPGQREASDPGVPGHGGEVDRQQWISGGEGAQLSNNKVREIGKLCRRAEHAASGGAFRARETALAADPIPASQRSLPFRHYTPDPSTAGRRRVCSSVAYRTALTPVAVAGLGEGQSPTSRQAPMPQHPARRVSTSLGRTSWHRRQPVRPRKRRKPKARVALRKSPAAPPVPRSRCPFRSAPGGMHHDPARRRIIVAGAGPAGMACARAVALVRPAVEVLLAEAGRPYRRRPCFGVRRLSSGRDPLVARRTARNPRWLVLGICAIVVAGTLVRPDCAVSFGYVTIGGKVMGSDGKATTVKELRAKAYQDAYDSGACEKPHSRWHDWVN
ncbi:hypothetical protein SAMN05216252_12179 [Actinacidiphila glaucinigra]|uniref:Uncharacterized protein n=1 Tax=Actinacidiphila glaucinigra TaxID=235986 RepID=A0A239LVI6_9ACTN|nr:hypothetical protein SAMN05216252_12179 [Actinacidiphila glaucinigra]